MLRFRQTNSSKATQNNGNQEKKTTSAFARMAGKRHCDERNSGATAAAVKKRNCLRHVRRPKDSEADYKAEFFVLGQSQAQQRRATSLLLPSERERSAKSEEQQAFCRHPRESGAQKAKSNKPFAAIRARAKAPKAKK